MVRAAVDAVAEHGSQVAAAEALGLSRSALQNRLSKAEEFGIETPEPKAPAPSAREVHDAAFLRRKVGQLQKQIGELEHVVHELGGIRRVPVVLPEWLRSNDTGRRGKSVVALLTSDWHAGEVITAGEMAGLNEFNAEICERRIQRMADTVCTVGRRWAADTDCKGVLLTVNGDLISGDIHDELTRTNCLTAHEQVRFAAEMLWGLINTLLSEYPAVHVVGTPGNHGRTTLRATAKLYAALSYDHMILQMVADRMSSDDRATFQIGATDQITPIFKERVFSTHGDKIGTGGGQGFAGPMLPIIRGAKKILEQQSSVGRNVTVIQTAHYHKTGNPYVGPVPIFANGSIPGYSEYAKDIRASVEEPQQWAYLLHDKWGVRERAALQLEDPKHAPLPRVRVMAGTEAA